MSLLISEIDGHGSIPAWTEEREAILKQMWKDGLTASQISSALGGVSRSAIIGKAHRLKLSAREERSGGGRRRGRAGEAGGVVMKIKSAIKHRKPDPRSLEIVRIPKPERPPDKSDYAVSLLDRKSGQCTWPLWDDKTPISEPLYCGAPIVETGRPGCSWCARHMKIGTARPRKPA